MRQRLHVRKLKLGKIRLYRMKASLFRDSRGQAVLFASFADFKRLFSGLTDAGASLYPPSRSANPFIRMVDRAHDVAYRVKWTTLIEQWPNHFCMSFFDFPPIEGPSLIHVDRDEYQYARSCQPF